MSHVNEVWVIKSDKGNFLCYSALDWVDTPFRYVTTSPDDTACDFLSNKPIGKEFQDCEQREFKIVAERVIREREIEGHDWVSKDEFLTDLQTYNHPLAVVLDDIYGAGKLIYVPHEIIFGGRQDIHNMFMRMTEGLDRDSVKVLLENSAKTMKDGNEYAWLYSEGGDVRACVTGLPVLIAGSHLLVHSGKDTLLHSKIPREALRAAVIQLVDDCSLRVTFISGGYVDITTSTPSDCFNAMCAIDFFVNQN